MYNGYILRNTNLIYISKPWMLGSSYTPMPSFITPLSNIAISSELDSMERKI